MSGRGLAVRGNWSEPVEVPWVVLVLAVVLSVELLEVVVLDLLVELLDGLWVEGSV
jgi:hypothetical protein